MDNNNFEKTFINIIAATIFVLILLVIIGIIGTVFYGVWSLLF